MGFFVRRTTGVEVSGCLVLLNVLWSSPVEVVIGSMVDTVIGSRVVSSVIGSRVVPAVIGSRVVSVVIGFIVIAGSLGQYLKGGERRKCIF